MSFILFIVFLVLVWLLYSMHSAYKSMALELREIRLRCIPESASSKDTTYAMGKDTRDKIKTGLNYLASLAM